MLRERGGGDLLTNGFIEVVPTKERGGGGGGAAATPFKYWGNQTDREGPFRSAILLSIPEDEAGLYDLDPAVSLTLR